jgi:nitric oxide reductase subunit B
MNERPSTASDTRSRDATDSDPGGARWELFGAADPVRQFATLTFIRGSLIALGVAMLMGISSALYSIPALAPTFQSIGIDLRQLRPLHTTFAAAWLVLGGVTVVHRWLQDHGGMATTGDRWRLRVQVFSWAVAGVGILVTLAMGIGSGREYLGFSPVFSLLILLGWLCHAWSFFRVAGRDFFRRPVYVTMWGVGMLFFTFTFVEQHLWLLPQVFADPILDLRIQWKATGTLVGSVNLFVYGAVIYIGERISRDPRYGHSPTAYALFGVGLLNSFTNFAHHTYHLPQTHIVKWIAFVVSMMEIIVLMKVMYDMWALVRSRKTGEFCASRACFTASKYWTGFILCSAILLAIPPLNAVVHGTYLVTGHAMGATIGIDSMVLLGAAIWVIGEHLRNREGEASAQVLHTAGMRRTVIGLNLAVGVFVVWLHISGLITGVTRAAIAPGAIYQPPEWLAAWNGVLFASTGGIALIFFTGFLVRLVPPAFRYWWVAEQRR